MTWGEITDAGLAAAAELIGKPLRRTRMQWIETATRDAIRHFAWGIGDDNPLWLDPAYAESTHHRTLLAPPCLLYAVDSTIVAPKLAGVQWIYAGTDWTWYDHIRVNDTFAIDARLTAQIEKSGRRFSRWVLQSGEIRYTADDGRVVCVATGHCARTPRVKAGGAKSDQTGVQDSNPHYYEPDEIARIEAASLVNNRRGSEVLFFEDVNVGEATPVLVKGPLTITDIIAWYSATQGALHYGGAHADALRYRQRHADYHFNAQTGAKDSAGRGHLEAGTGRDVGMGGAYDVGPQRISWAQQMLCDWIGDHGFLHQLNVSVRQPNLVGDTIWWHGRVTEKKVLDGTCFAYLDVEALNQHDVRSAFGTAVVALPSKDHGPVTLPLSATA